jgi:hypothetical protein
VHNASDVRQIEIHTAEPLVLDPSSLDVEILITTLKKNKSPGRVEIRTELIQARGKILLSAIHKVIILFGIRKNCLINGGSLILYLFAKTSIQLTVIIIVSYHCYQLHTKFYRIFFPSRLSPYIDEIIGDQQCGFRRNRSTTDHIF